MRAVALGFSPEHLLVASYALPQQQYSSQAVVNEFNHELLRRLEALPGVQSGGLSSVLPMSNSVGLSVFVPEGYIAPKGPNMSAASTSATVGNFYSAMRIRLLRGRFFTDSDNADAPLVVIVNHKLAQHYWPGQDPIGKRLRFGTPELKTPWLTIVGEVADVKQESPDVDTRELYYQPLEQCHLSLGELSGLTDVFGAGYIVLRTTLPPEQMQNALRSTVRSLDPQLALSQVQTMEQAAAVAAAAVLLAALGIYSIIAFSVQLRVREIAIRMALGSQRKAIVGLILLSAIRLMALGCVLGLLGALAASRLINSLLFQVNPFDPLVLTLAAVAILVLVMAASAPPAIQAASVDPMNTLRAE
jgi:putative ABC transport system permease protein